MKTLTASVFILALAGCSAVAPKPIDEPVAIETEDGKVIRVHITVEVEQ